MRRLTKKKALTLVKELDAFPKVPESYVESTASGGTGTVPTRQRQKYTVAFKSANMLLPEGVNVAHFYTLFSVFDSIHCHGCPCLPGIHCVQRHMDEVRVRSGQRLQQVRAEEVQVITSIFCLLAFINCLCPPLTVN